MAGIDDMGIENARQGICGFTSALYAVYQARPALRGSLERAMTVGKRTSHLKDLIRDFLKEIDGQGTHVTDIEALTRSFGGAYTGFTVSQYLRDLEGLEKYSIAMPPETVIALLESWNMRAFLAAGMGANAAILGCGRAGITNRWRNLAHYVYRAADGRIYSWGEQFADIVTLNQKKKRAYRVQYIIAVHG